MSRELEKIGEGREAEIFAWEEGTVLRLLRDSNGRERLLAEAAALRAAKERGCPVPAPGPIVIEEGRPGLVMERVRGGDLLTLLGAKPWMVLAYGRLCAAVHHALHQVTAPSELRDTRSRLRARIEKSGLEDRLMQPALELLERLPDGDRLCHGDFHPGNVLLDEDRPVVIDWANVTSGAPICDVARTNVMIRLGDPPPGTSGLVLRLLRVGRRLFSAAYLTRYRKLAALDADALRDWETVNVAARLAERIDVERERLFALLDARLIG